MSSRLWLPATLAFGAVLGAESAKREAPSYSAAGIVNAATNLPGPLAPNTIATLYGTNLANATRAVSNDDIRGNMLPTALPAAGVRVWIGELPAHVYYVSPTQINLLIPSGLNPGTVELQLTLDGRAGPVVLVQLSPAAPGLFQLKDGWIVATRPDGSVVTPENPVTGGEFVILYAVGLGRTVPNPRPGELASRAAVLERLQQFGVLLDGSAVSREQITYAGMAPGFAGLYQINLKLSEEVPENPEVRLRLGDDLSPEGFRLPLRK